MAAQKTCGCSVAYLGEHVVVTGDCYAIHEEAQRILRRFMYSATPLRVSRDTDHEVVLAPARSA